MINFVKIFLFVINTVSFVIVLIFVVFGLYEQIMGPANAEKLLEKLNIPLSYNQVLIIGFVSLAIMIISHIVRTKLSGE